MKKSVSVILVVAMLTGLMGLSGCGTKGNAANSDGAAVTEEGSKEATTENAGDPEATGDDSGSKIHLEIAYMVDVVDTSMQTQFDVGKQYCDYLSNTRDDLDINLTMYDAKSSVETQISNFETCLTTGVDGIILSAVDSEALASMVKQAEEEGVPVLDWRNDGGTVNFVGANETDWGNMNAQWVRELLDANPDMVLNAGIEYGATSHPQCFPRLAGLKVLEEEYPGRFNILVEQYGDWSTETCQKMVEDWLQAYPDMNFISTASELTMMGCVESLRGAGVLDDFILTTFNGEQPGVDMLKAGDIDMVVGCAAPAKCGMTIQTAIQMILEGLKGTVDVSDQISECITPETVEEYEKKLQVDFYNVTYFEDGLKPSYK